MYNIYKYTVFEYCILIPPILVSVNILLCKTSYLYLQNTVVYKTWNSVLLTHMCTKHLKIHLGLIQKNASYCFECRASFCMENCMKYICSESVREYIQGIWNFCRKCHIRCLQRDATYLNSPILAKDIKNSMTTIHTYSKSANGSSHNAMYHKFCAFQSTCPHWSVKKM